MEIDYIFPRTIFNSKKSAHAKTLTEWKTAFILRSKRTLTIKKLLVFLEAVVHRCS